MKVLRPEVFATSSCGAKAAACAQLAQVAAKAGFQTPAGVCLPFGSMEAAIKVTHLPNSPLLLKVKSSRYQV